jgi:hypothetical protein
MWPSIHGIYFLQQATFYIYSQCRYRKLQTRSMLRILKSYDTDVTECTFVGGIVEFKFSPRIQKLHKMYNISFFMGHLVFV